MSLPILHLSGTPYEQGQRHGEALRDRIDHNLALYFERFEQQGKLPRAEVLVRAAAYLKQIELHNADYFAGLRGIAAGSGADLAALAALNVRYEILYYQMGVNAMARAGANVMADGCTSFAVARTASANGHLLMGQNWDWIPQVRGALLHTVDPDGMETIAFTEAGIVGAKIGLNVAGVGLAVNGITSTDDDWSRLSKPFHVRCYEILRSRDFDAAVQVVTGAGRACSTNFVIAQAPDRMVDIEAAPEKLRLIEGDGGCLVHTNHFLDAAGLGVVEPPNERRPYSCARQDRMQALLRAGPIGVAELQGHLRDHRGHPYSICRHADPTGAPEQQFVTVTSVVMDLDARELYVTDGPPCEDAYQRVALGDA